MDPFNQPIILFCSERSGSNLICKIFDAHPDICAPGASHLFKVMTECASRYITGSAELKKSVLDLFDAKISWWAIDDWSREQRMDIIKECHTAVEMATLLYQTETSTAGKSHTFIKENSVQNFFHLIRSMSKCPRVLFLVRDPRDMAVSWKNGPVMRGGTVRSTQRWLEDQSRSLDLLANLPPEIKVSFLRYEDLLDQPKHELKRVCNDLNIDFHTNMLSFSDHSRSSGIDSGRSSMWKNLNQGLLSDNKNKFQDQLNEDEIAYINLMCGSLMQLFNYKIMIKSSAAFSNNKTIVDLEKRLLKYEPFEKETYMKLPIDERNRFENWSRLHSKMQSRPHTNSAVSLALEKTSYK